MTDLERLELVLRRVHDWLDSTTRYAATDGLYVLRKVIEELAKENKNVNKTND